MFKGFKPTRGYVFWVFPKVFRKPKEHSRKPKIQKKTKEHPKNLWDNQTNKLAIFGSSILSLIMIIAVLDSTRVFRLTRSVSVSVVVMDYVEAAKLRGEKLGWIMRREILPNIMPPLIAEFGLRFSFVFLTIAALSFLGLGIQPPTADWGSMVRDNASMIQFAKYDLTAALTPMIPAAFTS